MTLSNCKPPTYLKETPNGCTITIYVQPNAKKTAVVGDHGEALKVQIQAPPVDDKANKALQEWLAETLGISRSQITLKRGKTSRLKVFEITHVSVALCHGRLSTYSSS